MQHLQLWTRRTPRRSQEGPRCRVVRGYVHSSFLSYGRRKPATTLSCTVSSGCTVYHVLEIYLLLEVDTKVVLYYPRPVRSPNLTLQSFIAPSRRAVARGQLHRSSELARRWRWTILEMNEETRQTRDWRGTHTTGRKIK